MATPSRPPNQQPLQQPPQQQQQQPQQQQQQPKQPPPAGAKSAGLTAPPNQPPPPEGPTQPQQLGQQIQTDVRGYENVGFMVGDSVAPPSQVVDVQKILEQVDRPIDILEEYVEDALMTEQDIRSNVIAWAKTHTCWTKGFAKKMEIKSITGYPALKYELLSFCEDRKTVMRCIPFSGGLVDGPQNGTPPPPWAIPIQSTGFFKTETLCAEVPHTCQIHPCFKCDATGAVFCKWCGGEGYFICSSCWGTGFDSGSFCSWCYGRGVQNCYNCKATGLVTCRECEGFANLKTFAELVVNFHTVRDTWIYDRTSLPLKKMNTAPGKFIMKQVDQRVSPIQGYKVNELNKVSYDLINKHAAIQQNERIHYQGHHVEAVPVTEVIVYQGKKKQKELVLRLFGNDRRVYFPDYPGKACCC